MEFAILGPVEVRADGRQLVLGGPKQRAVLAILLLHANQPVSRDRLIDGLWGESPPPSAAHTLDDYVSRLRRLLGRDRIERCPPGYLIRLEPGELDLDRFEQLLELGRSDAAAGDMAAARTRLRDALALWRGRPLADLEYEPFAAAETARLEERRLLCVEATIDVELGLGAGAALVSELERLVDEHPFRERFVGQLMVSLYRARRQADALAVYQACRRRFAEELGLEPSAELQALEQRILRHDVALDNEPSETRTPPRPRPIRWRHAAALGVAVLGIVIAAAIVLAGGGGSTSGATGSADAIFELGAGAGPLVSADLRGHAPVAAAVGFRSVWVTEPDAGAVVRVDGVSGRIVDSVPVGGSPGALAVGGDAVWVANVPGGVVERIDPATERVTETIGLGGAQAAAVAYGLRRLWVADPTDEVLLEVDPMTRTWKPIQLDLHPTALTVHQGAIWVVDHDAGLLARVDPRSGRAVVTRVGNGPTAVAVGDGAVWVANSLDQTVSRLSLSAGGNGPTTIAVGDYPVALAISGTSIEVGNEYSSTVSRIDARRDVVTRTTKVGGGPMALVSDGNRFWVGTRVLRSRRGGTLVLVHERRLSLDPALQNDLPPFQSNGLTYDTLTSTARIGGPPALQLVPDLAESIPDPTNGGTTYTFQLRSGIRYSNGQPVQADDFRRALERLFRIGSPYAGYYTAIVGAAACTRERCDLARGVVTDNARRTITFYLTSSNPDFLQDLSSVATAPIPPGTPFRPMNNTPIPGTGPYIVASSNSHAIRYVRNRYFQEWSHAAQPDGNPDQIVMRYGLTDAQETRAVEHGRADWISDPIPPRLQFEVRTRFPAQVHPLLSPDTEYLQLNTTIAPFDDVRVRQALNLAVDRSVIARMYGGQKAATPTCQILPPGVLGYRRYCPYTRSPTAAGRWAAPDPTRARRLVAASGTRGDRVVVWADRDSALGPEVARYVVHVLSRLGYRARARFVLSSYLGKHPLLFRRVQMTIPGWLDPTPFGFFGLLFECADTLNHRWFCDPKIDHAIQQAHALQETDTRAAGAMWAAIDRELVNRAIIVPLVNPHWIDFVSRRVENYQGDPYLGLIVDQVTLR